MPTPEAPVPILAVCLVLFPANFLSVAAAHVACARFAFIDLLLPRDLYRTGAIALVLTLVFGVVARLVFPMGIGRGEWAMEILVLLVMVHILYRGDLETSEVGIFIVIAIVARFVLLFLLVLGAAAVLGGGAG